MTAEAWLARASSVEKSSGWNSPWLLLIASSTPIVFPLLLSGTARIDSGWSVANALNSNGPVL